MKPRIVFAIFSALQKPSTVAQLAEALAPHTVLIHHDFRKQADFHIDLPNVRFVPNPTDTGWGNWGLSQGIYHTIQHSLREFEFDYLQLMSPTCLPIRPVAEFEQHVRSSTADVHGDFFDITESPEMMMVFGARCFAPDETFRHRVLRRMQRWYFGPVVSVQQHVSLSIRRRADSRPLGPIESLRAAIALRVTTMARDGVLYRHPFDAQFRPYIGSTWIGMKHKAAQYLVGTRSDPRVESHFRHLPIVDEILFPTFLANSGMKIEPGNHAVNTFTVAGNPEWITDDDFDRLTKTQMFFARKFPDDSRAPVRLRALERLHKSLAT